MTEPRMPNADEVEQLMRYLMTVEPESFYDGESDSEDEAKDYAYTTIQRSAVAVFDECHGDEMDVFDKLMTVVWPGHPTRYEAFIWRHGQMMRLAQDPELS